jgi:hypothetical protein
MVKVICYKNNGETMATQQGRVEDSSMFSGGT